MSKHREIARSKEYQALVVRDFRNKVYPLALACAVIFFVFFIINLIGSGNAGFIIPDALAASLFVLLGVLVKRSVVPPYVGSILILTIITLFYATIILNSGSVHGILFFYCAIPFFAFYMAGTRIGIGHGIVMVSILLTLWVGGSYAWFKIQYSDTEMMVLLILMSFTITSSWFFERVREKTFAESYQSGIRHETLMEALDEVYYRVGMDGIIQEMGEAIYTLTGFSPSEVENQLITNFYANPDARDAYVAELQKNGSVKSYPLEIVGKYGQHVMISMSSKMFFDANGAPVYIEGLIRDMTKEREIQKERAENLKRLRSLSVIETALSEQDFEVSLQKVMEELQGMFDADRVFLAPLCFNTKVDLDAGYIGYFITLAEDVKSFDIESFMGEVELASYMSSVPENQLKSTFVVDDISIFSPRLIEKYQLKSHLTILIQIKPQVLWLMSLQQCEEAKVYSGQKKRLFVDISQRVRGALGQLVLQKDLEATVQRVEVASKAKSEFLATMSHELRTPLHGVIGLLDLLGMDMASLPKEQQRNLALAQTSSQVLSSLIDDVLDLAKIESGKVELQRQSFYLKDALSEALVPFMMKAREKGLGLSLEMKDVAEVIEGDVVRLRQVLLNLVGNAIKFTMKGYVRIVVSQDEETLQINIEDSGIGIDASKQGVVFKPFSQVHDVTILGDNLQEKGTGLGTTISQHFVHMMGGTLTLQSEPNIGSTLCIRLPLQQIGEAKVSLILDMDGFSQVSPSDKSAERAVSEMMKQQAWSVLLAEDDPIGRRIAVKRLERAGFEVEAVADGGMALARVKEKRFDLLLTDIRMPVLDGMVLTKEIRALELQASRKPMLIIGLSAYALEEVRSDAMDCGMNEFVSKPVDMQALMLKLEAYCYDESSK